MKLKEIAVKSFFLFLFITNSIGCTSKETATAIIFERKHMDKNQLMIKYRFQGEGGRDVIDSAIIDNTVIGSDTILVTFDKKSLENSTPQLRK
jgi:hypothetical protein